MVGSKLFSYQFVMCPFHLKHTRKTLVSAAFPDAQQALQRPRLMHQALPCVSLADVQRLTAMHSYPDVRGLHYFA